jgi:hypothetical protein
MKSELLVLSIIAGSARHMNTMVACASLMISTAALATPPCAKLLPVTKLLEAEGIPFQPLGDSSAWWKPPIPAKRSMKVNRPAGIREL